jgi:ribonuclease BN (tRNA processing enzyme)
MNPTIKFLGCGGAFAPITQGNSSMLIQSNGKYMLLDCGGSVQFTLQSEFGVNPQDIDAMWISHLHGDHIGSIEWLAFYRYFVPKKDKDGNIVKLKLFMIPSLMKDLWEKSLQGGLQSVESKIMNLTDYFDCIIVPENSKFIWEDVEFQPVQTIHVMAGYMFMPSYGLIMKPKATGKTTFVTTDTQFCPYQLRAFYNMADQIFHDCETIPFKSHVHAHYTDLATLPIETKNKMWLYHYKEPISEFKFKEDGFKGFVTKGQVFDL